MSLKVLELKVNVHDVSFKRELWNSTPRQAGTTIPDRRVSSRLSGRALPPRRLDYLRLPALATRKVLPVPVARAPTGPRAVRAASVASSSAPLSRGRDVGAQPLRDGGLP